MTIPAEFREATFKARHLGMKLDLAADGGAAP